MLPDCCKTAAVIKFLFEVLPLRPMHLSIEKNNCS